jgi:hypothetical protein
VIKILSENAAKLSFDLNANFKRNAVFLSIFHG